MALTTNILDQTNGKPAANVLVELYLLMENSLQKELIHVSYTNEEGRTDEVLLTNEKIEVGEYELLFYIGDYFKEMKLETNGSTFLNMIPVRFGINDREANYHVRFDVSTGGYQVYLGD
ncbi:hydroxyisourate hydrolase [Oceanobacillus bengalensis]|uniref:5-hydroxyisourate hydrolase n=1 Tax=Oceanobacillus bengalensis TaxID=1435466 RepID=A0A494Z4Z4_9BACI|nr:hydroxyisourate hydrolase [Oceanobacillus bengalensis]RKQ17610.1 hydroxyisourate hydrolase [Oceanobacillus bengalensis]